MSTVINQRPRASVVIIAKSLAEGAAEAILAPPKPCGERLGNQSWCVLDDGHGGDHKPGAAAIYGPLEEFPRIWREHRGMDPDVERVATIKFFKPGSKKVAPSGG